jgi:mono/diheme cytochrome c family protein
MSARDGIAATAAVALVALATACGATRLGETAAAGVPAMTERARRGEVVFMQRCHKCHPDGEAGLGPAINGKPLPGWLLRIQIRQGLGAMPAFGDDLIGDAQMEELLEYLALR